MRIYLVLQKQNRKKLNRFLKFINSPYFNINKQIVGLAEYLIEAIKAEKPIESKERIWEKIIKTQPFEDIKFRKLCNDVLERFERFLINERLDEDKLLQANLLLESIKQNKFDQLFEKQTKKSNRLIEREIDRSAEFYLRVYFNKKVLQSLSTNYEKKSDIKNNLKNLTYKDLSQNLDSFYVIEKLRHATDILTWRKLYKTDIELDLGFTLDLIDTYKLDNVPAVKVYSHMYKLMSGEGDYEIYSELKSLAKEVIDIFPVEEQREIIDVLLSFVIKDVNKGDKNALSEVVSLYDWGIDSEIILNQGNLSPTTFRNYVVGGLRLGLYDKVETFIKKKSHLLAAASRENAINFNLSRLEFYRKNYDQVLMYLNKVNYDDVWYSVNSRNNLLAVYYEKKEFEALESQMESFASFLRREKSLEANKRTLYMNFIIYLRKIYKNTDKDSLLKIREELNKVKLVNNKSWLLEKIEELL